MASININGTRKIQLLTAKKNPSAPHIKIGNYYGELTTDKSKTNGNPTLCFARGGVKHYIREKFSEFEFVTVDFEMNDAVGYNGTFSFNVDPKYNDYDYEICEFKGALSGKTYNDEYASPDANYINSNLLFNKNTFRIAATKENSSSGNRPMFRISRNKNVFTVNVSFGLEKIYKTQRIYHFKFIFYKRE